MMRGTEGLDDVGKPITQNGVKPAEEPLSATQNLELRTRNLEPETHKKVIYLKDRSFNMLKKDLLLRNPLRLMGYESEDILSKGGLGAVLARAGVGKTAFLVQLALNGMLRSQNVLHVSLDDPVKKVGLWYEEVLRNIASQYRVEQINQLWEAILPHRLIMTFKVESFSVPKLEERLTDLTEQGIFFPQITVIDGLPFDDEAGSVLSDLKTVAANHAMRVWFAVRTHRHEERREDGVPVPLVSVADLFELIVELHPVEDQIHVRALKGKGASSSHPVLHLDPSTMLIQEKVHGDRTLRQG